MREIRRGRLLLGALLFALNSVGLRAEESGAEFDSRLDSINAEVEAALEADENVTLAALSDELRALEILASDVAETAPEDAAKALRRKAIYEAIYLEAFAEGRATLDRLVARFPDTEEGRKGAVMLKKLEVIGSLQPGAEFPPFTLTNLEGEPLHLEDFRGQVVLVDFWATWCPPCRAALPDLKELYAEYHDEGFEIIGLSLDQSQERLEKFLEREEMAWPQFFDGKVWESPLVDEYGVLAIPTTFLLDREGKIVGRNLHGEELQAEVAKLFAAE
jgi:thiol-disulfide isomerase/thioredoxin